MPPSRPRTRCLLRATTTQGAHTHCACQQQSNARWFRHFGNRRCGNDRIGSDRCDRSRRRYLDCHAWRSDARGGGSCRNGNASGGGISPASQRAWVDAGVLCLCCTGRDEQGGNDEVTNLHGCSFLLRVTVINITTASSCYHNHKKALFRLKFIPNGKKASSRKLSSRNFFLFGMCADSHKTCDQRTPHRHDYGFTGAM